MSIISRFMSSVALATVVVAGANVAQAATYDISNDFSLASNPNGVWTYAYSSTLGGALTNYDTTSTPGGLQDWTSSTDNNLGAPADFNNQTGATIGIVPAHTAAFHPGASGEFSVYRFTSPVAATFNLSAIFAAIDSGGTDVHILLNGVSIYSHEIDPQQYAGKFQYGPSALSWRSC